MSVRMAIAKLTAAAAAGAVVGGGAVHVAEPQAASTEYKVDGETDADGLVDIKTGPQVARRHIPRQPAEPRVQHRLRRTIERECCEEQEVAMGVPLPLPPLPAAPVRGGVVVRGQSVQRLAGSFEARHRGS